MKLTFTPAQADRLIEFAGTFRESGAAQRVVERDPAWENATIENQSTVGRKVRRKFIGQGWAGMVRCDPNCAYAQCKSGRKAWTALFGADVALVCSNCVECNLMADGKPFTEDL